MAKKRGRPKKRETIETEWMVKLPTLQRRCAQYGLKPSIDNLRKVDKFGGTAWGGAYVMGIITRKQFEAADEFALLRRRYILALGAPSETPLGSSQEAVDGRGQHSGADYGQNDIATYNALVAFMGSQAEQHVIWFCLGKWCHLPTVKVGLGRIAEFFQIEVAA